MSPQVDEDLFEVLHSGYIGQGAKVDEFEARLAEYLGTPFVVTVNSGTAALHLAYRLANVGQGDEVISTPMTCQATNQPLLERGAKIVWADVNPRTGNISPESVLEQSHGGTKAIVCVHYGGTPCDLRALRVIADYTESALIEDCAHAFGATYDGTMIGATGGRFRCFSFQAIKLLTTVDGGLLVCENEADYKRAKLLRWYGMSREDKTRVELRCEADVAEHGYKMHLSDPLATIGLANLAHVPELLARTRKNAAYYDSELMRRKIYRTEPTARYADRRSSFWLYVVLVDEPSVFIPFMKERGVHVSHVHVRNDIHSCFGASLVSLPGVDEFVKHQCAIPCGWWVSDDDRERVMDAITEYEDY
jgi:dTDP-4-amino-4,6-dideoxygalactose transaminase